MSLVRMKRINITIRFYHEWLKLREDRLCIETLKKLSIVIQLQNIIYIKFIDFYNNYLKNYININLWLINGVKLFYIFNV